jgi:osmoprotectant transport system ATP-binding protein
VADFVGRDRGYRGLGFQSAPQLPLRPEPTVRLGATEDEARAAGALDDWLLVTDENRRPLGWIEPSRVRGTVESQELHRGGTIAAVNGTLRNALDAALSSPSRRGVVVDETGAFAGTVLGHQVLAAIESAARPPAPDRDLAGRSAT